MLPDSIKEKMQEMIEQELPRVKYGAIYVELYIQDGKVERITTDTRKSMKIYQKSL
jgi:hypothetical protein